MHLFVHFRFYVTFLKNSRIKYILSCIIKYNMIECTYLASLVKWYNAAMVRLNCKFDSYRRHQVDSKLELLKIIRVRVLIYLFLYYNNYYFLKIKLLYFRKQTCKLTQTIRKANNMEQIFTENGFQLDPSNIESLSDQGSEFLVYKYLDSVIKIYKDDYELSHLSLEELNILKKILTQRILLPTDTLWNSNHELIGYKMPFIDGKKSIECDSLDAFFDELEILKQDLDLLCDNNIILRDINLSNTKYNGHIYLIDSGNYLINELDKIIFHINITNPLIIGKLNKIIEEGNYNNINILVDSLLPEEKQNILRSWNYNKINELINMLLFSKRSNIDPFKYRQIVQFIMKERNKNGFIYNLDVLKMFFDKDLSIGDAVDDFIKRYIKDNPKEKALFLSLYKK